MMRYLSSKMGRTQQEGDHKGPHRQDGEILGNGRAQAIDDEEPSQEGEEAHRFDPVFGVAQQKSAHVEEPGHIQNSDCGLSHTPASQQMPLPPFDSPSTGFILSIVEGLRTRLRTPLWARLHSRTGFHTCHVQSCGAIVRFFSSPPTREEVQAEESQILYGQDEEAEVVDVESSNSEDDIATPGRPA
jgi:hypothetical protein